MSLLVVSPLAPLAIAQQPSKVSTQSGSLQYDEGGRRNNLAVIQLPTNMPPKVKMGVEQPETILQGAVIVSKRLEGATIQDLARDFNLSEATVRKRIEASRQVDLVEIARGIISDRLVPLALAVVDKELKKGNYSAAKDVLQGIGVFNSKKGGEAAPPRTGNILDAIRAEQAIEAETMGKKNGNE